MKNRLSFSKDFKKEVVEQIISGGTTTAATSRKYSIAYALIARWQKEYAMGKLDNTPTIDEGWEEKVNQLEQMIDELTMENALLKKILKQMHIQQNKNAPLLEITYPHSKS